MKSAFIALTFLLIFTITFACTAQQERLTDQQVGRQISDTDALIECAISIVHLCNLTSCESVPVFFVPEDKYPLKINLNTHEVISLYDKGEVHRSLVLEARKKSDRLEVLGRAEKSSFNGLPMSWLMQIYYQTGNMILSGAGKEKGVVIFGSCKIGGNNRETDHVAR